jgi:hypothetical protein
MALTSSGAIKMSDIKAALDPTSNSLRVYAAAAKATTGLAKFNAPDAFSDFYSYAAPPPPTPPPTPPPPTYNAFLGAYSAASAYTACNTLGPLVELYSLCSTLAVNCKLYTTNTAPFMVAQTGYYSIGTNWYYVGAAGNIDSTGTCASTLPPPTPPPPTPAPTQTTFTGFVSTVDEGAACDGGEYGLVTITVFGTTLCDATSVRALSSATIGNLYADFTNDQVFYINRLGKVREFERVGPLQRGNPTLACSDCPTPAPTPPPPTPAPPTPAPPTPPPPTPPPPTPPPPTPAPLPIYNSVYLSSGTDPCDAKNNSGGIQA